MERAYVAAEKVYQAGACHGEMRNYNHMSICCVNCVCMLCNHEILFPNKIIWENHEKCMSNTI